MAETSAGEFNQTGGAFGASMLITSLVGFYVFMGLITNINFSMNAIGNGILWFKKFAWLKSACGFFVNVLLWPIDLLFYAPTNEQAILVFRKLSENPLEPKGIDKNGCYDYQLDTNVVFRTMYLHTGIVYFLLLCLASAVVDSWLARLLFTIVYLALSTLNILPSHDDCPTAIDTSSAGKTSTVANGSQVIDAAPLVSIKVKNADVVRNVYASQPKPEVIADIQRQTIVILGGRFFIQRLMLRFQIMLISSTVLGILLLRYPSAVGNAVEKAQLMLAKSSMQSLLKGTNLDILAASIFDALLAFKGFSTTTATGTTPKTTSTALPPPFTTCPKPQEPITHTTTATIISTTTLECNAATPTTDMVYTTYLATLATSYGYYYMGTFILRDESLRHPRDHAIPTQVHVATIGNTVLIVSANPQGQDLEFSTAKGECRDSLDKWCPADGQSDNRDVDDKRSSEDRTFQELVMWSHQDRLRMILEAHGWVGEGWNVCPANEEAI
ncbi:hypothetical protein BJ508DRAFT_315875 [Ascobolus immersus RN42]|uniref:Uncharacterized protein n=1 Tax=Ascobolus immersus RN42 TaxID=1160509 RepID=A0A3N4H8U5_ASCIM|nr:hypothetical protein BJ508DRAFT_315875 [Ascobolus immersus RN42]